MIYTNLDTQESRWQRPTDDELRAGPGQGQGQGQGQGRRQETWEEKQARKRADEAEKLVANGRLDAIEAMIAALQAND